MLVKLPFVAKESAMLTRLTVMTEISAQLTLVMLPLESVHTRQSHVIAALEKLELATLNSEFVKLDQSAIPLLIATTTTLQPLICALLTDALTFQ
jgi:hypothetical protein